MALSNQLEHYALPDSCASNPVNKYSANGKNRTGLHNAQNRANADSRLG